MNHKIFRILCLSVLIGLIILSTVYDYFVRKNYNMPIKLVIKSAPMLCLMILDFSYIIIYRATLYSCGILLSLLLCLIGDLFMGVYDPSTVAATENSFLYLILSGSFFFTARILFTVILAIKPYKKVSLIRYDFRKILMSHICFSIPFLILGLLNITRDTSLNSIFVSLYIILGFGIPLSYSFLRIGALNDFEIQESKISSILGFLGILLFNASDIILFIVLFTNWLANYVVLISINLYWLSMYLMTISIVRSSEEYVERGNY